MSELLNKYKMLLADTTGVESLLVEMNKQAADAVQTYRQQHMQMAKLAARIQERKKVLLLGMGASHFVNEIFSLQLRACGVEAWAMTASEFLYSPVAINDRLVILTSQSGESIETVKCMNLLSDGEVYGITLSEESSIAKGTNVIVASGGAELAYAGTRSVTLSLAVMAYITLELGGVSKEAVMNSIAFAQSDLSAMERALGVLYAKRHIVVTGRSLFSGLAHLFSLGLEELSGQPIVCNEAGQLRHGPVEVLSEDSVLLLFRQSGRAGTLAKSLSTIVEKSSCALIVIDSSGMTPLDHAITIHCPVGNDIAAALGVMTTFQELMVAYACKKNPKAGIPKYSSKVTKTE